MEGKGIAPLRARLRWAVMPDCSATKRLCSRLYAWSPWAKPGRPGQLAAAAPPLGTRALESALHAPRQAGCSVLPGLLAVNCHNTSVAFPAASHRAPDDQAHAPVAEALQAVCNGVHVVAARQREGGQQRGSPAGPQQQRPQPARDRRGCSADASTVSSTQYPRCAHKQWDPAQLVEGTH